MHSAYHDFHSTNTNALTNKQTNEQIDTHGKSHTHTHTRSMLAHISQGASHSLPQFRLRK